jgi:hypothetical protein
MSKVLLAIAVTLAGCGAIPTPSASVAPDSTGAPDFVVRLVASEGLRRRMSIYDPMDLLVGVRVAPGPPAERGNVWWDPVAGDPDALVLAWLGGVCGVDPNLRVTKEESTLTLAVFDGHIPNTGNNVCGDVGIVYALALTFREPVAGLDVNLSLSEEPQ